jgi:predicted PurR-regulated permease PerM
VLWENHVFGIDVRAARAVWTGALVILALYCAYTVRTTLLVVLSGVFFSYLVYPLFSLAQRVTGGHLPRVVTLGIVFALIIGVLVLAGTLFGTPLANESQTLAQQLPKLMEPGELQKRLPLPSLLEPLRARIGAMLQRLLGGGTTQALAAARGIGTGLLHVAGNMIYVVVVPILSFLMVLDAPIIAEQTVAISRKKDGEFWSNVVRGLNDLLSHYVRALALLSLATLVVYSAVLSLLGAPFALLLALLAALLEIIPVFGPLVAAVSILVVAAVSGYEHLWWLAAFITAYRIFQDYMLSPFLMSEGVNVPPILVVFGLLAGDELAGVPGIFLSVPVLAAVRIVAVQIRNQRSRELPPAPPPEPIAKA